MTPESPDPTEPTDPTGSDASAGRARPVDPVIAQRERVARLVSLGQRIGYSLFGLFAVLVVIAFLTGFPAGIATAAIVCIVVGSIVLAPAIVMGYAVKAADRADREDDWR